MKKKLPTLKSDKQAEDVLNGDMSEYLNDANFTSVSFEFLPKTEKVNLRLPAPLLQAVKEQAKDQSMPYQKYIRYVLEKNLPENRP